MAKLTVKQQRFANEYLITGNATEAAILAGYSKRYTNTNTSKLLQNEKVKKYIDDRLDELEDEKIAKQDEILKYLTSVLRGEATEQVLCGMGNGVQKVVEIQVGAKDRIKAAELLGKRYGIWTDKVDVTGNVVFISGDDELED